MANGDQEMDSGNEPEEAIEDVARGCFGSAIILIFLLTLLLDALALIITNFI